MSSLWRSNFEMSLSGFVTEILSVLVVFDTPVLTELNKH